MTCLIIASSYVSSRTLCGATYLTATGACLNPAIALGTSIAMLFSEGGEGFKWVWLYGAVPFGGAILGVVFHEFIFKQSQQIPEIDEIHYDDEDDDNVEYDPNSFLSK
mmetsp:Transcript_19494/g.18616  ORF Transcript_19494/g.18616 Transcript_19494/m.18616 type:complete len:108 (+) Transcript_19494:531-854(+)